jgi:hypothetical protein
VDFATTALKNGACTINTHIGAFPTNALLNTLFTQWLHEQSRIIRKQHHSLLSGKYKLFDNIILTQNHAWYILILVVEISI